MCATRYSEGANLRAHIVLTFLLVELAFFLCGSVLVLLVLRHKVIHVALGFCEFHFRHPLACVPVKECLAPEHRGEVLCDTLEHFLNSGGIPSERDGHLQPLRWNVADACFNIVRNPFDEVGAVLILYIQHLLVHSLSRHTTTEERRSGQITTMTGIGCAHHILCVEHLLCELRNRERTVLLRSTRCERREACHEEVKTRERNEIDRNFTEVAIQLPWEAQASRHAAHGCTDKVIQITVCRSGQFQGTKADVIQGLVVKEEALVSILDQLMEG